MINYCHVATPGECRYMRHTRLAVSLPAQPR